MKINLREKIQALIDADIDRRFMALLLRHGSATEDESSYVNTMYEEYIVRTRKLTEELSKHAI